MNEEKRDNIFGEPVKHNFPTVITKVSRETISDMPEFLDTKSFEKALARGTAPISVRITDYSDFENKQLKALLKERERRDKNEERNNSDK